MTDTEEEPKSEPETELVPKQKVKAKPEFEPKTEIKPKPELDADTVKKGKAFRRLDFDQVQVIKTTCWDDWDSELENIAPNAIPDTIWFT